MSNRVLWTALAGCAVLALFCAAYPMYVIRPFRAQGVRELDAALLLIRVRPILTLFCLTLAALATARLWFRTTGWRMRVAVAGAMCATLLATVAVRVNVFEMMFHPVEKPNFAPVAETKLDADEKVLAVLVAGSARAYPIRAMAYHHVVNDTVGGVPIVATY